jgi:hypothetical protein
VVGQTPRKLRLAMRHPFERDLGKPDQALAGGHSR